MLRLAIAFGLLLGLCWADIDETLTVVEDNVLTPPYFNIASGKKIEATATCGTDGPDLFCKLTGGSNYEYTERVDKGQVCGVCDADVPKLAHPAKYAIDGTEKWWQSPPLSRGSEYNKVNVTVNLGQVFHVAYVLIKFANSPRAGTWVLERSSDHGKTFQPWQYFANTESDCYNLFGMDSLEEITRDDSVICTADYSGVVPLENGEVIVTVVKGRPGAQNFSYATVLQEWSKATDIRLRFLRTKTLLGHLMAVSEQDPTVTRRYYYSIKDISIGGRCVCNGHAEVCEPDPFDQYKLKCQCRHNTCGDSCEYCCPGFEQKAWRAAVPESTNECEACNCHGHATLCRFDRDIAQRRLSLDLNGNYEGGGVCINCTHNTAGINCEQCASGYWRPAGFDPTRPDGCRPCDCDSTYTLGSCEPNTGRCYCKVQYAGDRCDRCAPGYYDFPECRPCDCFYNGTVNDVCLPVNDEACPCRYNFAGKFCSECAPGFYGFPVCQVCDCQGDGVASDICDPYTGKCPCADGYDGPMCDRCASGYFNYPLCQRCQCSDVGTTPDVCDPNTGECYCGDKYTGLSCDDCKSGFYGFPRCQECQCTDPGSLDNQCDSRSGRCVCKPNYAGERCDECAPEYYGYPNCVECACDVRGSLKTTCDADTGECLCRENVSGQRCERCSPEYFNFPKCEECSCDPRGIVSIVPGVCLAFSTGQCECKENVMGKNCDMCKPLHYDIDRGCVSCNCFIQGTLDGVGECDTEDGQCWCRPYTCTQRCSQCEDGFFNLEELNYLGCTSCECDVGGAMTTLCDKNDGQCRCKNGIDGRRCNRAADGYYFPTLYQNQYEIEYGRTPERTVVRYGFDSSIFPDFSMKGYAEFSVVQRKVIVPVTIHSDGLYRLMFRYVNAGPSASRVNVTVSPETAAGTEQSVPVTFEVSSQPRVIKVTRPFVLNRGTWTVVIEAKPGLLVDYLVLLPSEFYEPGILQLSVTKPCVPTLTSSSKECVMFTHISLADFTSVELTSGVASSRLSSPSTAHPEMVKIDATSSNPADSSLETEFALPSAGKYVLVLEYASNVNRMQRARVTVTDGASNTYQTKFNIYSCPYSFICRQVALGVLNDVQVFDMSLPTMRVNIQSDSGDTFYVKSLTAIPLDSWNMELVEPKPRCITTSGPEFDQCLVSSYKIPFSSSQFVPPKKPQSGDEPLPEIRPPTVGDNNVDLIYLDGVEGRQTTLQIPMDLKPGRYVFLVHYYNPGNTGFSPRVVIDGGVATTGETNVTYCPFSEGCRGVVITDDGRTVIDITVPAQTFTLTVPKGKSFWVQYVLAVPEDVYNRDLLSISPIDKSADFISQCSTDGQQSFYKTLDNPSEFCRDSIFSLTVDYNNGGLECNCSGAGTVGGGDATCAEYGGQCPCKPNIIGRQCDRCKTGYYGYPDCVPCDCDGALCDPMSGDCICPPNTVAPACDVCAPFTHSFHPEFGCVDCDCHIQGVVNVNETGCNPDNGQCECKDHVTGHRCDQCEPGYFGFPNCQKCVCDERGSVSDGCDPDNGQCVCKENVVGLQCDRCKEKTIFLDINNPQGCTECFCFGVGEGCSQSQYPATEIFDMKDWWLLNTVNDPEVVSTNNGQTVNVDVDLSGGQKRPNKPDLYWAAPSAYSGDLVGSYGGELTYTATASKGGRGDADVGGSVNPEPLLGDLPDVILQGNNFRVGWTNPQPSSAVRLKIVPENFKYVDTGVQINRREMMMLLSNVQALHIRASPDVGVRSVSLDNVVLTTTDYSLPIGSGPPILGVEECACPPAYVGHSCQDCQSGHFRQENGPIFGYCEECNCYPHCLSCDDKGNLKEGDTCLNNTAGEDCGACIDGYIKNTTSGATESCQPCPCPFPDVDGNFADTCEELDGELICHCRPGYAGDRCELCASGYFGNPAVRGGSCQRCNCHGNLDPNLIMETCDPLTGQCSDCMFNTGGKYCEICADGFYGDAVVAHNCTECSCDSCGTAQCHHKYGHCSCNPNVVGELCDSCKPGFYNFQSCTGCLACDCAEGALNNNCDVTSGQCECAPNIVGKRCDRCANGFYDYSPMGCKPCQCRNNGPCNPKNGQCECPPGITGAQCDECELSRHILPEGSEQCKRCGTCTDDLLDVVEPLTGRVTRMITQLQNVSLGVHAYKRLDKLQDRVDEAMRNVEDDEGLISEDSTNVNDLLNGGLDVAADVGSGSGEVSGDGPSQPLTSNPVQDLDNEISHIETAVSEMCNHTDILLNEVQSTENATMKALENARSLDTRASEFLTESKDLLQKLKEEATGDSDDYAQKLAEAEAMLDVMRARNFSDVMDIADAELEAAQQLVDQINSQFADPAANASSRVGSLSGDLATAHNKLKDLRGKMNNATQLINDANTANSVNSKNLTEMNNTIMNINKDSTMATDLLSDADQLLNATKMSVNGPIQNGINELSVLKDGLDQAMDELVPYYEKLHKGLQDVMPIANESLTHAQQLADDAAALQSIIESEVDAQLAANAYQKIVIAMTEAANAADEALQAAIQAEADVADKNLQEEAENAERRSSELLSETEDLQRTELAELQKNFTDSNTNLSQAEKELAKFGREHRDVIQQIEGINRGSFDDDTSRTNATAAAANKLSDEANKSAQDLEDQIRSAPDPNIDLSKELEAVRARMANLPQDIENTEEQASNLVREAQRLQNLERDFSMLKKIQDIQKRIVLTRNVANNVRSSIKFSPRSGSPEYVELRTPIAVVKTEDALSAEFMVHIDANGASDNSLMFIRDAAASGGGDYMAVETKNGLVNYHFKVGDGVGVITSEKPINTGVWHKIIVSRRGKQGNLTIQYPNKPGRGDAAASDVTSTETRINETDGQDMISGMRPRNLDFYLGGLPIARPSFMTNIQSDACISDLKLNSEVVGIWNFKSYSGPKPGRNCERVPSGVTAGPVKWRFRGINSYLQIERRTTPFLVKQGVPAHFIGMAIRTVQDNSLLFLIGETPEQFIALEIVNGKFKMSWNFGFPNGPMSSIVEDVPDIALGNEMVIRAGVAPKHAAMVMSVNLDLKLQVRFPSASKINITGDIYIGGQWYNDRNAAFRQYLENYDISYRGCLYNLNFNGQNFNMLDAYEQFGVTRGCQIEGVQNVMLNGSSYLMSPSDYLDAELDGTVVIKSDHPNGTILDSRNLETNARATLLLRNGIVVLEHGGRSVRSHLPVADDRTHMIRFIARRDGLLSLKVDNGETVSTIADRTTLDGELARFKRQSPLSRPRSPLSRSRVNIYIGGAEDLPLFVGCIGDIFLYNDPMHTSMFTAGMNCGLHGTVCTGRPVFNGCNAGNFTPPKTLNGALSAHTEDSNILSDELLVDDVRGGIRPPAVELPSALLADIIDDYDQECRLSFRPVVHGYRYVGDGYSKYYVKRFNPSNWRFSLLMRTNTARGILFFMSDGRCQEHITLYLIKGKLVLSVMFGSDRIRIKSLDRYDNEQWHRVTFERKGNKTQLMINGRINGIAEMLSESQAFPLNMPFYVGGLHAWQKSLVSNYVHRKHLADFSGCIKAFEVNSQMADSLGTGSGLRVNVVPCFEGGTEPGMYIPFQEENTQSAHMVGLRSYTVGVNVEITMEIKPRAREGIILAVSGTSGDFFNVALLDGELTVRLRQNGETLFTKYDPALYGRSLCDGEWHSITVNKAKNVLALVVDDILVTPVEEGNLQNRFCHTDGLLYVGGVPDESAVNGLLTTSQYTGCIRMLRFDYHPINPMTAVSVHGDITSNTCPLG